jgi:chromosome segregation ATPase
MKRLNMVLSELEKATHEKSDIASKLRQQERLADELKHKLEEISGLKNVVNRNLQDDLRYERDLNQKLREELDRFEREKESLLSKLREEEDLSSQIQRETHAINSNLLRRTDDLQQLELEHEQTSHRLHQLNDELEALKHSEVKTRQQKAMMDSQLAELTAQRNDLIKRMNELSDRYETYVDTMNRERQDISRQNKQQVKHLVAKLLVQILNENLHKKRKNAFLEVNNTAKQMANLERCLAKLNRVVAKYIGDSKRRHLRLWYRNAFNCVHETRKRNLLIDDSVKFKREQKFFYLWRQAFMKQRKSLGARNEASKQFKRLMWRRAEFTQRNALCRWRDFVEKR